MAARDSSKQTSNPLVYSPIAEPRHHCQFPLSSPRSLSFCHLCHVSSILRLPRPSSVSLAFSPARFLFYSNFSFTSSPLLLSLDSVFSRRRSLCARPIYYSLRSRFLSFTRPALPSPLRLPRPLCLDLPDRSPPRFSALYFTLASLSDFFRLPTLSSFPSPPWFRRLSNLSPIHA